MRHDLYYSYSGLVLYWWIDGVGIAGGTHRKVRFDWMYV